MVVAKAAEERVAAPEEGMVEGVMEVAVTEAVRAAVVKAAVVVVAMEVVEMVVAARVHKSPPVQTPSLRCCHHTEQAECLRCW